MISALTVGLIWTLLTCLFSKGFLLLHNPLTFIMINIGFYFAAIQVTVLVLVNSAFKMTGFSE